MNNILKEPKREHFRLTNNEKEFKCYKLTPVERKYINNKLRNKTTDNVCYTNKNGKR